VLVELNLAHERRIIWLGQHIAPLNRRYWLIDSQSVSNSTTPYGNITKTLQLTPSPFNYERYHIQLRTALADKTSAKGNFYEKSAEKINSIDQKHEQRE